MKQYPVENLGAPDTIISRRQNQYPILSQSGCARLSNADCQGINALSLDWRVTSVSCRAARACVTVSVPCSRKVMPVSKKARPQSTRTPRERVRVLITGARIQKRIQALAREIRKDFPGEPLHLISVLKGGVFFLTDLARSIPGEVSFDFIAVSSFCAWPSYWTSRNGGSPRYAPTTLDFPFPTNLWSVTGLITPSVTGTCPTLGSYCLAQV